MNEKIPQKLCVAIAVKNLEQAKIESTKAIDQGANYIEFRFDYCPEILKWNRENYKNLFSSLEKKVPIIATFRSIKEGGKLNIKDNERIEQILKIIEAKPDYIDIEAYLSIEKVEKINKKIIEIKKKDKEKKIKDQNSPRIVFSFHNFNETPDYIEVEQIFLTIKEKFSEIIENPIYKLIFYANDDKDNAIPFMLLENYGRKYDLITFCMGELGIKSRVLSIDKGAKWTFVSISKSTAPGQVSIYDFKDYWNKLKK